MAGERKEGRRGFTLIEVLVAFVILALALGAMLPALSGSLRGTRTSSETLVATAFAQSLLAGVGVDGGVAEGIFTTTLERPGFTSVLTVRPWTGGAGTGDGPRLYEVIARIDWRAGGRQRTVSLATTRYARPLNR